MKVSKNLILFCLFMMPYLYGDKIGLLINVKKDDAYLLNSLICSAELYFCPDHEVTYFIFSHEEIVKNPKVVTFLQKDLNYPYDQLMRGAIYLKNAESLENMDYLFVCDVDMFFVATVGNEILEDHVATLHPNYIGTYGDYETRGNSTAFVWHGEPAHYFTSKFFGGKSAIFLKMMQAITANIFTDLHRGIIAVKQIESHLNRYFIDNRPTKILDYSYCYPQGWNLPYKKRIIIIEK